MKKINCVDFHYNGVLDYNKINSRSIRFDPNILNIDEFARSYTKTISCTAERPTQKANVRLFKMVSAFTGSMVEKNDSRNIRAHFCHQKPQQQQQLQQKSLNEEKRNGWLFFIFLFIQVYRDSCTARTMISFDT